MVFLVNVSVFPRRFFLSVFFFNFILKSLWTSILFCSWRYYAGTGAALHGATAMPWLCWRLCGCSPFLMLMLLLLAPHAAGGWLDAFFCCCYCWSCSLVSFLPHVIKLDTTTFFWVTWFVCFFLLVLYSPSPPVSVPDPTQALTFDPALDVVFAVVVVWFSWGSLVVIPNKWFFSTRIFSPNRVYVFLLLTEAPLLSEELPDYLVIFCLNDESLNQEAFFKS